MKFIATIKTTKSTARVCFSQLSSITDYAENNFLVDKIQEICIIPVQLDHV